MIYSRKQSRAKRAVRVAKRELRLWERRYDLHDGSDPMRFVAEIRLCEKRYAEAVEALRLARDGRRRLPVGEASQSATPPRAPSHDQPGD